MMLGGNPTDASPAATNLLYTGEQYDANLQQYYLRARYYNPSNGRFNQLDPFAGNYSDPQSLHKYLYCHANPVNAIDPSGMFEFNIGGLLNAITTHAILISCLYMGANALYNLASFATADMISKNHYEPSGRWITSTAGLALGFGPIGGIYSLMTARGTSTGKAIVGAFIACGLVFPVSKVKDGVKYLLEHKSDLADAIKANWNQNPLDNGLKVVNIILNGFRNFSQNIGAEFKQGSFEAGLMGGNGIVMNAPYAGDVVGLSVGGGGTIQGVNVGVYGEAFFSFTLSEGFTGVVSVGGGMTLSFATKPTGLTTVGISLFLPRNMKDWGIADL
jgi:RHS repeat-associated protein